MGQPSDTACNAGNAVAFAVTYKPHCQSVAQKLNIPVENILGLAAEESLWGTGRIAHDYNNYFSMHAKSATDLPKYAIGAAIAGGTAHQKHPVYVAKYKSFNDCAESFSDKYGNAVRDKSDPTEFAKALIGVNYNTGDAKTGGRDDFVEYLIGIIHMTRRRMNCSQ
jgi:flagellum-specific peptidoglycan hydrolase FlgJ